MSPPANCTCLRDCHGRYPTMTASGVDLWDSSFDRAFSDSYHLPLRWPVPFAQEACGWQVGPCKGACCSVRCDPIVIPQVVLITRRGGVGSLPSWTGQPGRTARGATSYAGEPARAQANVRGDGRAAISCRILVIDAPRRYSVRGALTAATRRDTGRQPVLFARDPCGWRGRHGFSDLSHPLYAGERAARVAVG